LIIKFGLKNGTGCSTLMGSSLFIYLKLEYNSCVSALILILFIAIKPGYVYAVADPSLIPTQPILYLSLLAGRGLWDWSSPGISDQVSLSALLKNTA